MKRATNIHHVSGNNYWKGL